MGGISPAEDCQWHAILVRISLATLSPPITGSSLALENASKPQKTSWHVDSSSGIRALLPFADLPITGEASPNLA